MGQIVSGAAKPKRCNLNKLSQLGTPAAGEYILVSSDNSMNAAGQGNFDYYIVGTGNKLATDLEIKLIDDYFDKNVIKSTNLYDKTKRTDDYYYWTNGPAANSTYCYSDFIAVEVGKTYSFQNTISDVRAIRKMNWIVGFDANKNKKSTASFANVSTYTVPDGIAFIIFTISKNIDSKAAFVEGDELLPYETYFDPYFEITTIKEALLPEVTFDKIAFKINQVGKNKLNHAEVISNAYINRSTGTQVADTQYGVSATPYIPVSVNGLIFNHPSTAGAWGGAVYDANKVYLRSTTGTYTYVEGDGFVRWTMLTENLADAQVEEGNVVTDYEPYTSEEVIDPDVLPSTNFDPESAASELASVKIFNSAIGISLPDKLYAIVGDTLQVFYQGFSKCVNIENYNVLIACSKGKQYHRYFEYTPSPSDVGETIFGVTIYDNNRNVLGSGSCTLVTLAQPSAPSTAKNFMCVGDSLTANGVWVAEAYRRLTGSGGTPSGLNLGNITFGGSMTKDGAGYIGKSGWSWHDFVSNTRAAFRFTLSGSPSLSMGAVYTNNGHNYTIIEIIDNTILCSTVSASNTPTSSGTLTKVSGNGDTTLSFSSAVADAANPFWDGSKVSFTSYVNTYLGGSVDYVYTLLSWNGMQGTISSIMADVKTFADALHRDFPNAKLRLMGLQFPSMKLMMPVYGAEGAGYANVYQMYLKAVELQEAFQEFANSEGYSTWIEHINVATEFDSEYNMPITEKNVNTRNSSYQEPYANNGVHPGNAGYLQIGDVAYRSIVHDLSM